MSMVDPGAIAMVQDTFLKEIIAAFSTVQGYALSLLYIFAAFELVVFGLIWALQHSAMWERLFFKILKIGLIFFILQNYAYLVGTVLQSFTQVGSLMSAKKDFMSLLYNPALIWQYGYDHSLALLKEAALGTSIGFSMIQIILGFGILLAFGLFGIQIVVQLVGFYLVALTSLIMMPFGAFDPAGDMFNGAVQAVFKVGVRIMVLIMIVGVAVSTWHNFTWDTSQAYNINQPLGLFFTTLLFTVLAWYLPKLAAETVGKVNLRLHSPAQVALAPAIQGITSAGGTTPQMSATMATMQAATQISPGSGVGGSGFAAAPVGAGATSVAATVTTSGGGAGASGGTGLAGSPNMGAGKQAASGLAQASITRKSISESALKQIKKSFQEVIEEKNLTDAL